MSPKTAIIVAAAATALTPALAMAEPHIPKIDASKARVDAGAIDGVAVYSRSYGFLVASLGGGTSHAGRIVGVEPVSAGRTGDIRIKATVPLSSRDAYTISLRADTNKDHKFEAQQDKPVKIGGRNVAVTVPGGVPKP